MENSLRENTVVVRSPEHVTGVSNCQHSARAHVGHSTGVRVDVHSTGVRVGVHCVAARVGGHIAGEELVSQQH